MTLPTLQMLAGIYLSREMCSPATSMLTNESGPVSSGLEESWVLGQWVVLRSAPLPPA